MDLPPDHITPGPPRPGPSNHVHTAAPLPPPGSNPADLELPLPPALEAARQNLMVLNDQALAFVRERPLTCIFGAVAIGFVVGKIAARY